MEDLLPDVALRARGTSEPARGNQGGGRGLGAWKIRRDKGWKWAVFKLGIMGARGRAVEKGHGGEPGQGRYREELTL